MKNGKAETKILTVPASGPSGGKIRPEVIRAMEGQHRAAQKMLTALQDLGESVERAMKLGVLRVE